MNKITPEQKQKMLKKLVAYHSKLIDRGYCGRVTETYDQGHLQRGVHKDEHDLLEDVC